MKVGFCITTTPKRKVDLEKYKLYLSKKYEYTFKISIDESFEGVSQNRNKGIKHLYDEGCDYIFLFDDDCYPIMFGFDSYIIENMVKYGLKVQFLPNVFNAELISAEGEITNWSNYLGCFTTMSREIIENVGYFNTKYHKYGYEDAGYQIRVANYLNQNGDLKKIKNLLRIPFYIKSEDLYHMNPNPNYSFEEKQRFIKMNDEIFQQEINESYKNYFIPYHENI